MLFSNIKVPKGLYKHTDILVGAQNTFGRSLKILIVDTSGEFTWEFGERPLCYISWMLLGSGRGPS